MDIPFSFVFIFVVVPSVALFTAILGVMKRKKTEEKLFIMGIAYLKRLRTLLTYIQQHRGLTNSYLSGNLAVEAEIERIEELIKKEMADLHAAEGWIKDNSKWDSIADHWLRIGAHYKGVDAEVNLKQHNSLIANLLYLIDDLAYAHHLGKLGLIEATDANWRNLLFIAEYIGQARALGMGVVSKGFCSSVLRIQLNHLLVKIESNISPSWTESTQQDFRNFLQVIEEQVITDRPSITPAEYFKLATGCIEHVLSEFDRQVEKIQFHRT
jgi:hypothetical protein